MYSFKSLLSVLTLIILNNFNVKSISINNQLLSYAIHTSNDLNNSIYENSYKYGHQYRKVVIIGSGPAGLAASIYTARALLKPLQIAGYNAGGQLMLTSDVENFPGYNIPITGPELINDLTEQARKFGTEVWQLDCIKVNFTAQPFEIVVKNCTILADTVIISTGANAIWLNAENELEFQGKGISTCATCDGYLFRNKSVIVVGGGDSAMEEANFLTRFAREVTIVHRTETFRASKIMLERAKNNPKIKFLYNTKIVRWNGENGILSGFTFTNNNNNNNNNNNTSTVSEEYTMNCDGAFIAIGHKPNTEFLANQINLDNKGYILLDKHTMTNVPGVFACGDVADNRYRQAITAAGTGCQAAIDAERWLEENLTH